MKYSREQLIDMGLDESQINAIFNTIGKNEEEKKNVSENVNHKKFSNENVELHPTSLNDLHSYSAGTIIRLPDFTKDQPLIVRVKRPSLLALAANGKIPNSLLTTAGQLFTGGKELDSDNNDMLSDIYEVCRMMAEATLIEPTLAEIEGAGLSLTDEQLMAIFNYTQSGVDALKSFR